MKSPNSHQPIENFPKNCVIKKLRGPVRSFLVFSKITDFEMFEHSLNKILLIVLR